MPLIFPGAKIGSLLIQRIDFSSREQLAYQCLCDCGATKSIRWHNLQRGASTSCGNCNYKEKHPFAHKSWDSMRQRCLNPNAPDYPHYGGRGIKVCPQWDTFKQFLADMGEPAVCRITGRRLESLDRIDTNGDYTPENCRWSVAIVQNNNKTNSLHPVTAMARIKMDCYRRNKSPLRSIRRKR